MHPKNSKKYHASDNSLKKFTIKLLKQTPTKTMNN